MRPRGEIFILLIIIISLVFIVYSVFFRSFQEVCDSVEANMTQEEVKELLGETHEVLNNEEDKSEHWQFSGGFIGSYEVCNVIFIDEKVESSTWTAY